MNGILLVVGGLAGLFSGLATVLWGGAHWGLGIAVYFLAGYGIPLMLLALFWLSCSLRQFGRRQWLVPTADIGNTQTHTQD